MIKHKIIQYLEIIIGVSLLDIAYFFFFEPTSLVTGGIMGLSILVDQYLPFSPSIFMYICNISLLVLALFTLGKEFFIKTIFASLFSPTIVLLLEKTCNPEWFLQSVNEANWYFISMIVAGPLTALGLGLCLRAHGSTGGMDIVQKIMTKYLHIPYSKTMYFTDWVIVIIAGFFVSDKYVYLIEGVVYGVITVLIIGYVVDYIALNAKSRRTAYIITSKPDEMKAMIYERIGRGVTECDVRGGYSKENLVMLICTLDSSEAYRLQDYIHLVDEHAFTFMTKTKEVVGEFD